MELKKFNGKISDWQEFWDGFKSAIDDDDEMANVDKFKYLRSFLEEPAKSVVAGLSLTDANYTSAIELLHKRFAKPSVIKRAHINELINLSPVYNEKSVGRLRALHDQIETHFRGLEALGVDKESYSSVVVPVLMEKIPETMRYSMIRFGQNHLEWNVDELIAALEKEIEVRESHVPIFKQQIVAQEKTATRPTKEQRNGTAAALLVGGVKKCVYCLETTHKPEECEKIKSVEERKKLLLKYAKCFLCLNGGHRAFRCRLNTNCKACKGRHHSSICSSDSSATIRVNKEAQRQSSATALNPTASSWVGTNGSKSARVALQTALAQVNEKEECRGRVLFDTGSQRSFITAKAVKRLDLTLIREERLDIKAFGCKEEDVGMRGVCQFSLRAINGGDSTMVQAFVVNDISTIPNEHVEVIKNNYSYLLDISFSDISRQQDFLEVDVLIGSNYIWEFQNGEIIRGGRHEPIAVNTKLGWVLSGPLTGEKLTASDSSHISVNHVVNARPMSSPSKQDLDHNLHKLWDLDSLGIRPEDEVHEGVIDNILFTGERYSVGLPWKVGHAPLPTNYHNSVSRLKTQLKKLHQTPDILEMYDNVISEQVRMGVIEPVSLMEEAPQVHYIPHQAVCREAAETTKLRVVYDASCKDRKSGVSLNDCLHVGPALTPLIFDILLCFRFNKEALVGDIEKAFLNIEVHSKDRDCLRFLWVDDIHKPEPQIVVYRFNRVVFGVNSSPFLLNAVLRHHIEKYQESDPEFVVKMKEGFFVDDLVTGSSSTELALDLYHKAKERMLEGGFRLRKFKTNDKALAEQILEKETKSETGAVTVNEESTYAKETLGVSKDMGGKTKILGIPWDTEKDTLIFNLEKVGKNLNDQPTKRGILSTLASLFDPQGLVSPIAVVGKVLFQELCVKKLDWDDPLPEDKAVVWKAWLKDLSEVKTISVPRYVLEEVEGDIVRTSLHGFGDASKKSYCAMIYLVCETSTGVYTKLLCAKTRVAPLKGLSIPRLELMSAKILATLMDTVLKAVGSQVKIDEVKFWLDSKTALFWIANNGEWKNFVRHRVNEILKLTKKEDWGHVPGEENPADIGSRGMNARDLKCSNLWWEGPNWLKKERSAWPSSAKLEDTEDVSKEERKVNVMVTNAKMDDHPSIGQVVDIGRFSTLGKLLRVTAHIRRFIENLKSKKLGNELKTGELDGDEIKNAENEWIREAQMTLQNQAAFEKTILQLGIILENGVLVCKGRLMNSDLEEQSKQPIILPRDHKFTQLIILDCHHRVHHCKVKGTLTELRSRFWVTRGRQVVKKLIKPCLICKKLEGKPYETPPTAPLPDFRVTQAPPFSKVGVDFAGPLFVKKGKGQMSKVYITLFTCCVTRAIHLELVENLEASSFINCLRRFCARRGTPTLLISDNAKTFKATSKLLLKLPKDEAVQKFLAFKRLKWRFNLERAPWMGGVFERMIGSVKRCLRKVLAHAKLTFDELYTVLLEVEGTVNSRPLTYLYDTLDEVLTPSHLIFGYRLSTLSEDVDFNAELDQVDKSKLLKRFLYLTRKLNHFWNRWRQEYVTSLRESHRGSKKSTGRIEKGDLVLIYEENTKRGFWKTGIVEEVIKGTDGVVRGAEVRKIGRGKHEILKRPLQKLFPLEISCADNLKKEGKEEISVKKDEMLSVNEENNENEEKGRLECQSGVRNHTPRAAAIDARWKTHAMLDP